MIDELFIFPLATSLDTKNSRRARRLRGLVLDVIIEYYALRSRERATEREERCGEWNGVSGFRSASIYCNKSSEERPSQHSRRSDVTRQTESFSLFCCLVRISIAGVHQARRYSGHPVDYIYIYRKRVFSLIVSIPLREKGVAPTTEPRIGASQGPSRISTAALGRVASQPLLPTAAAVRCR